MVNLSNFELDEACSEILEWGLNFVIVTSSILHEDIICRIEDALLSLPEDEAEVVRQDYALSLRNARKHRTNISKEESLALNKLKMNKDIMILKRDKGNATFILNANYYHTQMIEHLSSGSYKKMDKEPCIGSCNKLK